MISSITILKKFKKHEREALLPLYQYHVNNYLIRIIANQKSIVPKLLEKAGTWQSVATCHEIALNTLFDISINTHQNEHGKEYEYSTHAKSKNVSRDRRVKLIWALLIEALQDNPGLDNVELLELDNHYISCPVCHETVAEYNNDQGGYEMLYENNCECMSFSPCVDDKWVMDNVPGSTLNHIQKKYEIEVPELGYSVIPTKWKEIILDIAGKRFEAYQKMMEDLESDWQ